MKHILPLLILLFVPYISYGQTFYQLLSEVLDSAYRNHFKKQPDLRYDYQSMPYKFHASENIERKKTTNLIEERQKIYFLHGYDAFLGKDTIMIEAYDNGTFGNPKLNQWCHNYSRISWKFVKYGCANCIFYKFTPNEQKWKIINNDCPIFEWLDDVVSGKRQRLIDLTYESLTIFMEQCSNYSKDQRILVIDNNLGRSLFPRKCKIEPFTFMVASLDDLTTDVLDEYKTLVGWCSIDLDGNTLSIQLRAVDSDKYKLLPDKDNVDDAVTATQTFHFRYCDEHKKWCMVK